MTESAVVEVVALLSRYGMPLPPAAGLEVMVVGRYCIEGFPCDGTNDLVPVPLDFLEIVQSFAGLKLRQGKGV
ncbi:MAG: hypothetical protein ACYTHJ_02565 [Planctomycetota bacterium]|jgi:hypothetical protein